MSGIHRDLEARAAEQPRAVAVIEGDRVCTYGELQARVERLSQALSGLGLRGQRVGVCGDGGLDYILLSYAVLRAGACVVPLRPQGGAAEAAHAARAIALAAALSPAGDAPPPLEGPPIRLEAHGVTGVRLPGGPAPEGLADAAFIRFTSGTTDQARGVVLGHASIRERHLAANQGLGLSPDDGVLFTLSMSHHFVVSVMLYLSAGCRVLLPERLLAAEMAAQLRRHRGTVIYGAPHHLSLLASGAAPGDLAGVRLAISTTAGLPDRLAESFRDRHGFGISQAYGIIEVGLPCVDLEGRGRGVGRPLPAYQLRLLSPSGGVGRVAVKGPGMFDAYFDPFRPRAAALEDGWFVTGDVARIDDQGRVELLGRESSVINFAGVKIFPPVVERQLNAHPAVLESLVYGAPHPRYGQVPIARVVAAPGQHTDERALVAWLRDRLPADQIPLEFERVPSLPRTPTGKLVRRPGATGPEDPGAT